MNHRKVVRAGSSYFYRPVMMDVCDPPYGVRAGGLLAEGSLVTVVKMNGCPPPGTMGMCHIKVGDKFAGLVCTNSLQPSTQRRSNGRV